MPLTDLKTRFAEDLQRIENYLSDLFLEEQSESFAPHTTLLESIRYSLQTGGKRFRPLLAVLTAGALKKNKDDLLPFGAAVELIHTYSLVHDDLPCMDNDLQRRGQPTNHVKFGESTALLTGDALLTEAFGLIAHRYKHLPQGGLKVISLLSEAAGTWGMVGGQALDLGANKELSANLKFKRQTHEWKTGALICASVEGAAILCEAEPTTQKKLNHFGKKLGFAFQLADDLLDHNPMAPEASGYPVVLGGFKTLELLKETSSEALNALSDFDNSADDLRFICQFNLERAKSAGSNPHGSPP